MNESIDIEAHADDELLSRYLDGELDDDDADRVTTRLAQEPALARRLEALCGADSAMRELYAKVDELPLPPRVRELLDLDDAATPAATADNVVAFRPRGVRQFLQVPVAIAAGVALAAGLFVDRLLEETPASPAGIAALQAAVVPTGSDVHELLEHGASGEAAVLADGSRGSVRLTFAAADGDWCRQLDVAAGDRAVSALACRRDGAWRTEMLAFGDAAGGPYQAASGPQPALAAALATLIGDGEILPADAEAALVAGGWKNVD